MDHLHEQQKQDFPANIGAWMERKPGYVFELMFQSMISLLFNSTIISLPLVGVSLWIRHVSLKDLGLALPKKFGLTLLLSISFSVAWAALDLYFLSPAVAKWIGKPLDLSVLSSTRLSITALVGWLMYAWISAALGEEIIFRGYFLPRIAGLFRNPKSGWVAGWLVSSFFFGFMHAYQGWAGFIGKFFFGLFLGALFIANRRSLWMAILVHGFVDTLGFLALFFGWIG